MLAGMMILGLIDNFTNYIKDYVGLWQFQATRSAMGLLLLVLFGIWRGLPLWPQNFWPVFGRSAFFSAAMLIYFGALPLLPTATVLACIFTAPAFMLLFSAMFFGEQIGWRRLLAVSCGFSGVLLVAGLDSGSLWMLLPVLGGACYAVNALLASRFCAQEQTFTLLVWYFGVIGVAGAIGMVLVGGGPDAPFPLRGAVWPEPAFYVWSAVQAVGSILAVGLITRAYQIGSASYLAAFEYSLLVFGGFWAWILFGQTMSAMAFVGIALILFSGGFIWWITRPEPLPETGRDL